MRKMSPEVRRSGGSEVRLQLGSAALVVEQQDACSVCVSSTSAAPIRLLVPTPAGVAVWAYLTGFGGGVLAGDRYDVAVAVGTGARLHVGTAGSTRVYRSAGPWSAVSNRLEVAADGLAVWACDPLAAFAQSRVRQDQRITLAEGASLVWIDGLTAGRSANGERWAGTVRSRLAIDVAGQPWLRDGVRLDPGSAAGYGPYNGMSVVALVGPLVAPLATALVAEIAARPVVAGSPLLVSATARPGGAVLRLAGIAQELIDRELRSLLHPLTALLGDDPWARRP
jgi:urease accessory protein